MNIVLYLLTILATILAVFLLPIVIMYATILGAWKIAAGWATKLL